MFHSEFTGDGANFYKYFVFYIGVALIALGLMPQGLSAIVSLIVEMFIFHTLIVIFANKGYTLCLLNRKHHWGNMQLRGFNKTEKDLLKWRHQLN